MTGTFEFQAHTISGYGDMLLPAVYPGRASADSFCALDRNINALFIKGNATHFVSGEQVPKILAALRAAKVNVVTVGKVDVNRDAVVNVEPHRFLGLGKPSATRSTITFRTGDRMNVDVPQPRAAALLGLGQ